MGEEATRIMKQFIFKKQTPQGIIDGILRIHEKLIYFKYNNSLQAKQVMNEFRKNGINIEEGKGWIKIDLLGSHEMVRLGDQVIDQTEDSLEEIEDKLFKFYKEQYAKQGFYLEELK
jgi:hypothetical protein